MYNFFSYLVQTSLISREIITNILHRSPLLFHPSMFELEKIKKEREGRKESKIKLNEIDRRRGYLIPANSHMTTTISHRRKSRASVSSSISAERVREEHGAAGYRQTRDLPASNLPLRSYAVTDPFRLAQTMPPFGPARCLSPPRSIRGKSTDLKTRRERGETVERLEYAAVRVVVVGLARP